MKNLVLMDKGTLATAPVDPLALGLRGSGSFESDSKDPVKTYMEQELRNQVNYKMGSESFQCNLFMLKKLIGWSGTNFDAQLVTMPDAGGNTNVIKMIGDNFFGMEFTYEAGVKKRSAKIDIERSFDFDAAKTFIDSADSNTAVTFASITNKYGIDFSKYRAPAFLSFLVNGTQFPVNMADLQEYKFIIKGTGKKSELYNTPKVNNLSFEIEVTSDEATIARIVTLMNAPMCPATFLKLRNPAGCYDGFNFAEGVLSMKNPFKFDDDNNLHTLKLNGKVNKYDISWLYGATNGGTADDTKGEAGGTMMIGHN